LSVSEYGRAFASGNQANEITLLHGGIYTDTYKRTSELKYLLHRRSLILSYHWINIICRLLDIIKLFSHWT